MYAILGDIHSSKEDLTAVLQSIHKLNMNMKIVGIGDLYECTISKKNINEKKYDKIEDVMLSPDGFQQLLTFPTVRGNQEERIIYLTETGDPLRARMEQLPEKIYIDKALVIHGHQWSWGGEPWTLQKANTKAPLTFFGHSHEKALIIDGKKKTVDLDVPYDVSYGKVLVNVGPVIGAREWVLYHSKEKTVTFKKG